MDGPCCGFFFSSSFSVFLKEISSMLGYFVGCFLLKQSAHSHMRNVMSRWVRQCIFPLFFYPRMCTCTFPGRFLLTKHIEIIRAPLPTSSSAALHRGPSRRHLQFCLFLIARGWTTCQLAADVVEG